MCDARLRVCSRPEAAMSGMKADRSWIAGVGSQTITELVDNPHDTVEGVISKLMDECLTLRPGPDGHNDVSLIISCNVYDGVRELDEWDGMLSGVDKLNLMILQAGQAGTCPPLSWPAKEPTVDDPSTTYQVHATVCTETNTASVHMEPLPADSDTLHAFARSVVLDPAGTLDRLNDGCLSSIRLKIDGRMEHGASVQLVPLDSGELSVLFLWSPTPADSGGFVAATDPPPPPTSGCLRCTGTAITYNPTSTTIAVDTLTVAVYPTG